MKSNFEPDNTHQKKKKIVNNKQNIIIVMGSVANNFKMLIFRRFEYSKRNNSAYYTFKCQTIYEKDCADPRTKARQPYDTNTKRKSQCENLNTRLNTALFAIGD